MQDEEREIEMAQPTNEESSKEEQGNSNVCSYCLREFPNYNLLRDHLIMEHEGEDEEGNSSPESHCYTVETICEVHAEERTAYPESNYQSAEETTYEPHEEETTGQPETRQDTAEETFFECDVCAGLFRLSIDRDDHIKDIHTNKYRCHLCGTSFPENQLLEAHIEKDHNSSQRCDICGVEKDNERNLKFHRFEHGFTCTICEDVFFNQANLYVHIVSCHDDEDLKIKGFFLCPICFSQVRFRSISKFIAHCQDRHPDVYPFSCGYCGRVFRHGYELRYHRSIHEPDGRKRKYLRSENLDSTCRETEQCSRNLSTCSTLVFESSSESSTEFPPDESPGFEGSQNSAAVTVSTPIPSHRSSIAPERSAADLQEFRASTRSRSITVTHPKSREPTTFTFSPPIPVPRTGHSTSQAKRPTCSAVPQSKSPKRHLTYPPSSSSSAKRPGSSTAPAVRSKTATVSSSANRPSSSTEKDASRRGKSTFAPLKSSPVPPSPAKPSLKSVRQIPVATSETSRNMEHRSPAHPVRSSGTERPPPSQEKNRKGSPDFQRCPKCGKGYKRESERRNHTCSFNQSKIRCTNVQFKIKCPKSECKYVFINENDLRDHLMEEHHVCPHHPDIECASKEEFDDHIAEYHQ